MVAATGNTSMSQIAAKNATSSAQIAKVPKTAALKSTSEGF